MQTPIRNSSINRPPHNFAQKKDQNSFNSNGLDLKKTHKPSKPSYIYPDRPLRAQNFQHIRKNRARLMDWYLEVSCFYKLDWSCYWCTVELLDTLIANFQYITVYNVHIVGMVCCFMAAKMVGGNSLTLNDVVHGIGHGKFSNQEILRQEGRILSIISVGSSSPKITLYSYFMEKCSGIPTTFLQKGLQMLVLAFMKPQISFYSLRVSTYRQLVDCVMTELLVNNRIPEVLQQIREDIKTLYGGQNVSLLAKEMRL